jgi:hypothetical protein
VCTESRKRFDVVGDFVYMGLVGLLRMLTWALLSLSLASRSLSDEWPLESLWLSLEGAVDMVEWRWSSTPDGTMVVVVVKDAQRRRHGPTAPDRYFHLTLTVTTLLDCCRS